MAEMIDVPITLATALNLFHWLRTVPDRAIPVTHPAERQALADLLAQLELYAPAPTVATLLEARETILATAGDWVNEGPLYEETDQD